MEYAQFFEETRRCSSERKDTLRLGDKKRLVQQPKTFLPEDEEEEVSKQKYDSKARGSEFKP